MRGSRGRIRKRRRREAACSQLPRPRRRLKLPWPVPNKKKMTMVTRGKRVMKTMITTMRRTMARRILIGCPIV